MPGSANTVAVLADVHGNRWALDAVLDDARRAGAERVLNLGDCVSGPLDPRGTAERLMALGALTVRGNHDRAVVAARGGAPAGPSDAFALEQLTDAQLDWLAGLPQGATDPALDGLLLCHGAPGDDERYLLEEVTPAGLRRRSPAAVRELLDGATGDARLILCGHTHLPALLPLGDGRAVLNPGSVGLPAFDDETPHPHRVQSASPHARYALLRPRLAGGWDAELRAVPYPWEEAAAAARARGAAEWATALTTGLAPSTVAGA